MRRGSGRRRLCRWGRCGGGLSAKVYCGMFVSGRIKKAGKGDSLHALGVELVAAGETHDPALAVDVFL